MAWEIIMGEMADELINRLLDDTGFMLDLNEDPVRKRAPHRILSDRVNEYLEFRLTNDKIWLTLEKKQIKMIDMTTQHILNCIRMLDRANQQYTKAYKGLTAELKNRTKSVDK